MLVATIGSNTLKITIEPYSNMATVGDIDRFRPAGEKTFHVSGTVYQIIESVPNDGMVRPPNQKLCMCLTTGKVVVFNGDCLVHPITCRVKAAPLSKEVALGIKPASDD